MGRKQLPKHRKRSVHLDMMLTIEEKERIEAVAGEAETPTSEWTRNLVLRAVARAEKGRK